MCLGSACDILQAGRPPRATFVDYPLGHSAGRPFDTADQLAVVRAAVTGFEHMRTPGTLAVLPQRWPEDDWQARAMSPADGDTRQPRDTSPQFQEPADRAAAVAAGARPA